MQLVYSTALADWAICQFKLENHLVSERLGTDIYDSIEKTVMHETMNYVDNYSDYNEIRTNHTPTPEITSASQDTPKQSEEPIADEDETAIATTTTDENETTINETRTSRPRRTKTMPRNLQYYIL